MSRTLLSVNRLRLRIRTEDDDARRLEFQNSSFILLIIQISLQYVIKSGKTKYILVYTTYYTFYIALKQKKKHNTFPSLTLKNLIMIG